MLINNDLANEGRAAPSGVTRDAMPKTVKPQACWSGSATRQARACGRGSGSGLPA